jgi:hypothetical protein
MDPIAGEEERSLQLQSGAAGRVVATVAARQHGVRLWEMVGMHDKRRHRLIAIARYACIRYSSGRYACFR